MRETNRIPIPYGWTIVGGMCAPIELVKKTHTET